MKLKEIIEKLDKSEKNSSWINISDIASYEFDINSYFSKESDRIKAYYFLKWYCTDSYVGGRVYFLDDKVIATSWQSGRKCNEDFHWTSKEAYKETRAYILTLVEEEECKSENIQLADFEEEFGDGFPISYSSQLLTDNVIYKPTGELVKVTKKFHDMNDIKLWSFVKIKHSSGEEALVDMKEIRVPYDIVESK